jgi:hypothetical protein
MIEQLLRLEQLSDRIVSRLDQVTVEELVEFVEQRDRLISELKLDAADEAAKAAARPIAERILRHDPVILEKLRALKDEAASAIGEISARRKQRQAYMAMYTPDGLYVDKKK